MTDHKAEYAVSLALRTISPGWDRWLIQMRTCPIKKFRNCYENYLTLAKQTPGYPFLLIVALFDVSMHDVLVVYSHVFLFPKIHYTGLAVLRTYLSATNDNFRYQYLGLVIALHKFIQDTNRDNSTAII